MGPTVKEAAVASPCINVCTLDPATQVCLGCFRTIGEIAAWGGASNAERAAIVAVSVDFLPLARVAVWVQVAW